MLARLRAAHVGLHNESLSGYIVLELPGNELVTYSVFLPCAQHPNPPGWRAVAEITGVPADEVRRDWRDEDRSNDAAERAMATLATHVGQRVTYHVLRDADGRQTVHLTILAQVDDPDTLPAAPTTPAPVRTLLGEAALDMALGVLTISAADPNIVPAVIGIPTATNPEPPGWYLLEAASGIGAAEARDAWDRSGDNPLAKVALTKLAERLAGAGITTALVTNGAVSVDGLAEDVAAAMHATGERPVVHPSPDLAATVHNVRTLLRGTLRGSLFRTETETDQPSLIVLHAPSARIQMLRLTSEPLVRGLACRTLSFQRRIGGRSKKSAAREVPVYPPRELLHDLLAYPDNALPVLRRIARIPGIRPDGTVMQTPGYDAATQLYYAPDVELSAIPDAPTDTEVGWAKGELIRPIQDFAWQSNADLAAAIACLMQAILLPMIDGPRPIYVFEAPPKAQGTGKSKLAHTLQTIVNGFYRDTPLGTREEEVEKRIGMVVQERDLFVNFDNVSGYVASDSLCILATSENWQSRKLGTNDSIRGPTPGIVSITMNGGRFSRDIARRVVMCRLDAGVADPFRRGGFAITDLIPWAKRRRPYLIRAAVILARAWVAAGRPADPAMDKVMGSFEAWRTVVGGVVRWLGLTGLHAACEAAQERDPSTAEAATFIGEWVRYFGTQATSAGNLAAVAIKIGAYEKATEAKTHPARSKRLARLIDETMVGGVFTVDQGTFRVRRGGTIEGLATFQLEAVPASLPN